jgi:putative oxidoreductase
MDNETLTKVRQLRQTVLAKLEGASWLALLLGRLGVGLVFVSTGWGKIHNIPKVTMFFESLHIPAPGLNAVFVGYTELICGAALVVGLASRLAAIPLAFSMVVAIATAKAGDLHGIFDLFGFDEFTYIVLLVMITILGPGKASIDEQIAQKLAP